MHGVDRVERGEMVKNTRASKQTNLILVIILTIKPRRSIINVLKCGIVYASEQVTFPPNEIDFWDTKNTVVKFIRRVPLVTKAIMDRSADYFLAMGAKELTYNERD